ncbi:hypothetical protein ACQ4LE_000076 [Meloidogyne hapla]
MPRQQDQSDPIPLLIQQMETLGPSINAIIDSDILPSTTKTAFAALSAILGTCKEVIVRQQQQNAMDAARELERSRSIVLIGVPESENNSATGRAKEDVAAVEQILDGLGVQVLPSAVYRMGRINPAHKGSCRLIKVILPSTKFQWQVLGSWKRSRDRLREQSAWKRLLIRPSLTESVLAEERKKREERRNNMTGTSAGMNTTQKNL